MLLHIVRILASLLMIAVLVVGYLLHSEGAVWRHSAIYSYYQYQMHIDLISTVIYVTNRVAKPSEYALMTGRS